MEGSLTTAAAWECRAGCLTLTPGSDNQTWVPGLCCRALQCGWLIQAWACMSFLAGGTTLLDFSLQSWDRVIWKNLQGAHGTGVLAAAIPCDVAPYSWLAECL